MSAEFKIMNQAFDALFSTPIRLPERSLSPPEAPANEDYFHSLSPAQQRCEIHAYLREHPEDLAYAINEFGPQHFIDAWMHEDGIEFLRKLNQAFREYLAQLINDEHAS